MSAHGRASDTPSETDVQDWILNGAARIDGELYQLEPAPPFTSPAALRLIKPLNIDYAASRVFGALENEAQAQRLDDRFTATLERIARGEIVIPGHHKKSTFRGGTPLPTHGTSFQHGQAPH